MTSIIALALTSILGSRALFFLFDDPEGPNLLIVVALAAFLFAVSVALRRLTYSLGPRKSFLSALIAQVLLLACLYTLALIF